MVRSGGLSGTDAGPCRLKAHPAQAQLGKSPEGCILDLTYLDWWSFDTVSCRPGQVCVCMKGQEPQPPLLYLTLSYFVPSFVPLSWWPPVVPSLLPSAFLPEQPWVLPWGLGLRALVRGTEFQVFKKCYCRGGHAKELLSKTKCHVPRKHCPCWSHCCRSRSKRSPLSGTRCKDELGLSMRVFHLRPDLTQERWPCRGCNLKWTFFFAFQNLFIL